MNNIWAFGCSFTKGIGYNDKLVYNDNTMVMTDKQKQYHWLPTLQQLINTGYNNYGIRNIGQGGAGMKSTLYTLLNNLPFLKPGDIVILGNTLYNRESYIQNIEEGTFKQYNILNTEVTNYLDGKEEDDFLIPGMSKDYNELVALHYMENSYLHSDVGLNYLHTEGTFINRAFRNLCDILESTGVRCYRWNSDSWYAFEKISEWTNGLFDDPHWSPNGDRTVGRFFYWCMKNGYKCFSHELLNTCKEDKKYSIYDFEYTKFREDLVIRGNLI